METLTAENFMQAQLLYPLKADEKPVPIMLQYDSNQMVYKNDQRFTINPVDCKMSNAFNIAFIKKMKELVQQNPSLKDKLSLEVKDHIELPLGMLPSIQTYARD